MRLHFITIPVFESAAAEAELNRFLASHRVLAVDRQLVVDGTRSAWAVCVSFVERAGSVGEAAPAVNPGAGAETGGARAQVDYRAVLSPGDFSVFVRLRTLRKSIAERDGVPAYAIFTNEQLAAMARGRPRSAAELGRLPGVGKARVDKYGAAMLAEMTAVSSGEVVPEAGSPVVAVEGANAA